MGGPRSNVYPFGGGVVGCLRRGLHPTLAREGEQEKMLARRLAARRRWRWWALGNPGEGVGGWKGGGKYGGEGNWRAVPLLSGSLAIGFSARHCKKHGPADKATWRPGGGREAWATEALPPGCRGLHCTEYRT
ncbi:hypothetical protein GQ53DRAFT_752066 [Thozetella sp. PMI_491]|nr:hypothetical protein GQ53DRAFT_752066 [Thozetella sp. PMI_491]